MSCRVCHSNPGPPGRVPGTQAGPCLPCVSWGSPAQPILLSFPARFWSGLGKRDSSDTTPRLPQGVGNSSPACLVGQVKPRTLKEPKVSKENLSPAHSTRWEQGRKALCSGSGARSGLAVSLCSFCSLSALDHALQSEMPVPADSCLEGARAHRGQAQSSVEASPTALSGCGLDWIGLPSAWTPCLLI